MTAPKLLLMASLGLLVGCGPRVTFDNIAEWSHTPYAEEDGIQVYFSPNGGAMAAIAEQIQQATKSIDVQAYIFASDDLAQALKDAHTRGVKVRVILHKTEYATRFAMAGLEVWEDRRHKEAHNKVMLVDGHTVITGSFNFTMAAELWNAENVLIIKDKPR